ncbi:PQQ-like beta-propeller repeat protein [Gemmata sp. JC717]|uniref:PQQ-like beta-propeller repeat protein n=1 Tax=Gemmata algarum TaxID=2975278 RepID=UPI0021BABA44|nr:PQQ-like beta-propeller repeat protein [Gemmata algarum]MDY3552118.1 PQQ-like beta-propeller repeat protein [Gemmata algarum]
MRGSKLRLLSAGALAALFAWLVTWAGHVANGQPAVIGVAQAKKDGKDDKNKKEDRSELDENLPFSVPYDRDAKNQLKAARDYLDFKDPPYNTICPLLQNILDAKSDTFFDVKYKVGETVRINRISVKTEANRIIAEFKPEGLQFYQQAYGVTASALLDDAIKANCDLALLSDVSQRYFNTKAGAEATVLLGTLHLERGNYLEAAYAFERLLPRKDVEDILTPRTLFKTALAFKRSGDPRHADLYKPTEEKLFKAARDGIRFGRTLYSLDRLRSELARPVELVRATTVVGEWAQRGGNPGRNAVVDGGPPFLDKVFGFPMFYSGDDEANLWIKGELEKLFARDARAPNSTPLPGTFPVTTGDTIVFRSYDGVYGVATRDRVQGGRVVRAGEILWRSKTTAGLYQLIKSDETHDVDMSRDAKSWWGTYNTRTVKVHNILHENPLIGSLSHDGQNVYFVDDLAITPPPVYNNPEFGINAGPQFRHSGDLADMVRAGRLAAVDIKSGNIRWELGRVKAPPPESDGKAAVPAALPSPLTEEEADKTTDAFRLCLDAVFLGAPMPLNGKLYVLIEQAGVMRLLCLDPRNLVKVPGPDPTPKPVLVWTQKLGKPNSTLPTDSVRRYQGCTLAASDGIIICPTNSGVVVAVDVMSRSLLWAHGYRQVSPAPPRSFDPNTGMPIVPEQLPDDRWRSAGPIVSGGRVILTAYDSRKLECLDLRTGKILWTVNHDASDLYVGGVANDRVIVVGKNQMRAYRLGGEDADKKAPKVAWGPVAIPTPTGHGAVGRNAFYVPVRQDAAGRDAVPSAEIWAINIEDGKVLSKTGARKRSGTETLARYGLGNLVFQDGMVYAQSPWEVTAYPQLELKIAEMNKLLDKNPKDPLGLLARGELRLDDGKLKDAIADFKDAERNNLPVEKKPLLREKLYIAYTELLRADFNSGESVLPEYEALCDLPALGEESPEDKVRREDEIRRRKRLYYYLLARGRETQERLGEAFEHYLALANLGEGKQLLDMPDEPNVKMRPDVWARGRLEAMIRRAATPEAKKSLETRVEKEWDLVKGGTDLGRLREFVAVFGPFFASGIEAQFKLADVLLSTNNEADAREAQTCLAHLRASSEDVTTRARATEALAQVMIKGRMMEDAVGLYLQLGKEYPNVVVRDGKTGADFLTNLLTDKRLLPFLEPSRYPLPTRVKAEMAGPSSNMNNGSQIEIESPPDLFPAYRRLRYTLDGSTGLFALRAFDRSTGAVRATFPHMQSPNMFSRNGQPIPWSRFVQGHGHLMLVQMGLTLYCYDLAEKKVLWDKNLMPDNPLQPGGSYQIDVLPNGDCELYLLPNTQKVPLGRSAVLQAGYCAVLTSDGLEAVEPVSRRVLWVRKNVSDRTSLFGDGRYIALVDVDSSTRKPVSAKLIRAVDGVQVEGSPDSGDVLKNARSYRLFGRHALITSGTDNEPRVLRLYDLATGKDVWKKEYDSKAVPITAPLNPDWTGALKADGTAEVLSIRTGETITTLKLDPKNFEAHLVPCVGAQVLADGDRFYLILDRDPNAASTTGNRPVQVQNNAMLRAQKVNGPVYAFDRVSGKRLWHYEGVLEHQWLVLEQFAELPVLIASAPVMNQNNVYSHAIVVIEKERGRLILETSVVYNGNLFQSLAIDPKNGTIRMSRFDTSVLISPDEKKP